MIGVGLFSQTVERRPYFEFDHQENIEIISISRIADQDFVIHDNALFLLFFDHAP
jgi:hypothetical protein